LNNYISRNEGQSKAKLGKVAAERGEEERKLDALSSGLVAERACL